MDQQDYISITLGLALHVAGMRLALPEGRHCRSCIKWVDSSKKCSETGLRLGTCHSTSNSDWYSACPLPITRENGVCINWRPSCAGEG